MRSATTVDSRLNLPAILTMHLLRIGISLLLIHFWALAAGLPQDTVTIHVNAAETIGPFNPIYAYFGNDEPNYTYMKNGRKLVAALGTLSRTPVYIRTHFML